jgi:hypothetical protein
VTIMFGISMLKGAIPQDRWDLFDKYYTLLRDRESQKAGADAKLIRDYKRHIDLIHYRSGFVLHVISETAGGASAHLSLENFKELIACHFEEEGYSAAEATVVISELVRIATQRLVLLNCRVEGQVAFDVRSLQEFMAAAQIAASPPGQIISRMRVIALSAHWQHVFRIAASKIFSVPDLGALRTDVVSICHAADNGDLGEDGRTVRAGAKLALELLGDGIGSGSPIWRKALVRRSLSLLDCGASVLDDRLVDQLSLDTLQIYREEIVVRISQGETMAAGAAWTLLFALLRKKDDLVDDLVNEVWPKSPTRALLLHSFVQDDCTELVAAKLRRAVLDSGPDAACEFMERQRPRKSRNGWFTRLGTFPVGVCEEMEMEIGSSCPRQLKL